MRGFYVLDLVSPCDGLPRYSNGHTGGYVERYSFRGQFLKDCTEIISSDLLDSGWGSKLPEDTVKYGDSLLEAASQFASSQGIDTAKIHLAEDPRRTSRRGGATRRWPGRRRWRSATRSSGGAGSSSSASS